MARAAGSPSAAAWVRRSWQAISRPGPTGRAPTGTAPLEASSGQVVRYRLSPAGDRKLNHALYMMAMVQVRRPSAGQAYYQRKLAKGKSPKEALRCLKRRLSDAVDRCLLADQHHHPWVRSPTADDPGGY
jgi:transposase